MTHIIKFISENWHIITGVVIPSLVIVYKMVKMKREGAAWKDVADIGLKFIEAQLASDSDDVVAEKKNALMAAQSKAGVKEKVESRLSELRYETKKKAISGEFGISATADIDDRGKLRPGLQLNLRKFL